MHNIVKLVLYKGIKGLGFGFCESGGQQYRNSYIAVAFTPVIMTPDRNKVIISVFIIYSPVPLFFYVDIGIDGRQSNYSDIFLNFFLMILQPMVLAELSRNYFLLRVIC